MMKTVTTRMTIDYNTTVDDIAELIAGVPSDGKFSVDVSKGDRPWDSDQFTVSVTWNE